MLVLRSCLAAVIAMFLLSAPAWAGAARGVILHPQVDAGAEPAYLRDLQADGWEVISIPVKPDFQQEGEQAQMLLARMRALRAKGVSRIVLAGEGYGAWVSLVANASFETPEEGAGLLAVIAIDANVSRQSLAKSDQWHAYKFINLVKTQDATRLALFLDDVPEDEREDRLSELRHSLSNPNLPTVIAVEPPGSLDKAAGQGFAHRFGGCLKDLLRGDGKAIPASCGH